MSEKEYYVGAGFIGFQARTKRSLHKRTGSIEDHNFGFLFCLLTERIQIFRKNGCLLSQISALFIEFWAETELVQQIKLLPNIIWYLTVNVLTLCEMGVK